MTARPSSASRRPSRKDDRVSALGQALGPFGAPYRKIELIVLLGRTLNEIFRLGGNSTFEITARPAEDRPPLSPRDSTLFKDLSKPPVALLESRIERAGIEMESGCDLAYGEAVLMTHLEDQTVLRGHFP